MQLKSALYKALKNDLLLNSEALLIIFFPFSSFFSFFFFFISFSSFFLLLRNLGQWTEIKYINYLIYIAGKCLIQGTIFFNILDLFLLLLHHLLKNEMMIFFSNFYNLTNQIKFTKFLRNFNSHNFKIQ